jgi:hypothetical protein
MRAEKREWIYAGLGLPEGIGLVRPVRRRPKVVKSVLVIGNDTLPIASVLPPLKKLLGNQPLAADIRPRTTATIWVQAPWLRNNLLRFRPSHVLVALDPNSDGQARRLIDGALGQAGAQSIWLTRPGVFAQGAISAPHRHNAAEVAAWAGRIWKAM